MQLEQARAWDHRTELIAQLVDLTAILAADMRTKGEPQKVKRPAYVTSPEKPEGDGFAHAIAVLRSTARP